MAALATVASAVVPLCRCPQLSTTATTATTATTSSTASSIRAPGWSASFGGPISLSSSVSTDRLRKSGVQQKLVDNGHAGATTGLGIYAVVAAEEALGRFNLPGLKADLLTAVAGLDRGLVATKEDDDLAESLAIKLEEAGDGIELPKDLDKLQGRWRLIFSSGFKSGSLGGTSSGPSISRLPLASIGLVHQRIDVATRELDNIVNLNFPTPWPIPPIQVVATLAHTFEVVDGSKIKIVFDKTTIKPTGGLSSVPPIDLQLPGFLRQQSRGSGEFRTTFVDKTLRISRGDRGELRIFVRA